MAQRYTHLFITASSALNYTSPSSGRSNTIPQRNPYTHGAFIRRRFDEAWAEAEEERAVYHAQRNGLYLEFKSDPGARLVTKGLEDLRSKKMRLLNVRTVKEEDGSESTYATVYVAHDKKKVFLDKVEAYLSSVGTQDKPAHADLVNSIADLRKALLVKSFWQDDKELIPGVERSWCEVWLSSDQQSVIDRFEELLSILNISSKEGCIRFPERTVKSVFVSLPELEKLTAMSDDIAEYRKAKESGAYWLQVENREQAEWVRELLERLHVVQDPSLAVCVLDTGVNNRHPLLSPILKDTSCLSVDPKWGVHDHDGHGTLMAGLAGYGDLKACLLRSDKVVLNHCLESVKILGPDEANQKELWGYITAQAVSRAEIEAPSRERILCMAVSATDTRDKGRPSSWSGAIDQLSSGASDGVKRLFVICAGNLSDFNQIIDYPSAQTADSVHDPGQSWNCLTVGAYTDLDRIDDPTFAGYAPVACAAELSPFTTTSTSWDDRWPMKPEIVVEGGNIAHDGKGLWDTPEELALLSTHREPMIRHFGAHSMTSAATAQAAWMAAQIRSAYPDAWPETVRALIVHSAEWTDALKRQFLHGTSKAAYTRLLRICGYGVPNLNRAMYSVTNSLTLIAQQELQPYKKEGGRYKTNEMHLYDLPWPQDVLYALPDHIEVKMRVTLSYFVEPGPGEVGWKDRYRYASYGLRFDVKAPDEDQDEFLRRINAAVRDEEEGSSRTRSASDHWTIGSTARDKGSIHSDIWTGTAAQLASSNVIAVYPIIGWWRERPHLQKVENMCRYSLVVSIHTEEQTVDVYTPVAIKLGVPVVINT